MPYITFLVYSLYQDLFSCFFLVCFLQEILAVCKLKDWPSLLFVYDIITLLNCKTDLIFFAYSQRCHDD